MSSNAVDFVCTKKNIEDLLAEKSRFLIPEYQRPYSWEEEQFDFLWEDVENSRADGYFIGSMIAWRSGHTTCEVIDGQQRLTTLAIWLSVIAECFEKKRESDLGEAILDRCIRKKDRENKVFDIIHIENSPYSIFHRIQSSSLSTAAEEKFLVPYEGARKYISGKIQNHSVQSLKELRDKLFGLVVIWIEHPDRESSQYIFETINDRGLNLSTVDLVKNHLFSLIPSGSLGRQSKKSAQWDHILKNVTTGRESLDAMENFLADWWHSEKIYQSRPNLFLAIKKDLKENGSSSLADRADLMLDSMLAASVNYAILQSPSSYEKMGSRELRPVVRSLEAIKTFGIRGPEPLLLAALKLYFNKSLPLKELKEICWCVERYIFVNRIINRRGNGGSTKQFSRMARDLNSSASSGRGVAEARECCNTLRGKGVAFKQFSDGFKDIVRYAGDGISGQSKGVVYYVLKKILSSVKPNTQMDDLTIEHIIPQSYVKNGRSSAAVIGSIGNLLLLPEICNNRLANKNPDSKIPTIISECPEYCVLLQWSGRWGEDEVSARADLMAEFAFRKVWGPESSA